MREGKVKPSLICKGEKWEHTRQRIADYLLFISRNFYFRMLSEEGVGEEREKENYRFLFKTFMIILLEGQIIKILGL